MTNGFERLKTIDITEIQEKTLIAKSTLEDILEKRFDRLNPTKAKGFVKIIENKFKLDLSDWTQEFDAYCGSKTNEQPTLTKLIVESEKNTQETKSKTWVLLPIVMLAILILYFGFKTSSGVSVQETNLSAEANETNITALLNTPLELNSTVTADINTTHAVLESNNTADVNITQQPAQQQVPQNSTFYAVPLRKLWVGIYYLDNNKTDFRDDVNQTIMLDDKRPQILVFGPGLVTVRLGEANIESKTDNVVRYIYDPVTRKIKYISKQEFETIRPPKKVSAQ